MVKEKNIENKVYFLNTRNDINEIMQAMDILVFPSYHEGLPVVLIEAQAAGLKIFASDKITKEVKITNLLEFISLDVTQKKWAKLILENKNYKREDTEKEILKAHYEMKELVNKLKMYYLN